MRVTTALLSAALTLCSTASFAQSSYNIVVEPVGQTIDSIIHAPIEYDENGVVKAQHFNADNLTDEEYQAILAEAESIRAYRAANGLNFQSEYVAPEYIGTNTTTHSSSTVSEPVETVVAADRDSSYQIELFAPETPTYSESTYTSTASAAPTYAPATTGLRTHKVSKGETLYRISKLYGVSIADIQAENGMSDTTLSVGQRVNIPGVILHSDNTVSQPIYANTAPVTQPQPQVQTPRRSTNITRRVVEPAPVWTSSGIETSIASEAVYAVLPKDTLYSISRRTCVGVSDIISRNDISNPNTLQPGQRLTLPAGHCLSR